MKLYLGDAVTVQERNRKRPPEGSSVISEMGTASVLSALCKMGLKFFWR